MIKLCHFILSISLIATAGYGLPLGDPPAAVPVGRVSGKFFGESDFAHAESLGFSTLALNTPKSFRFYRNNGITMNMTAKGSGVVLNESCMIMPATSPANPSHVAGIRAFYEMEYNSANLSNPPSTATIEITFAAGLPTTGYLLFVDLDASEQIDIKAYNSSDVLIPFSDITFARENGRMTNGDAHLPTKWSDIGSSFTGRIFEDRTGSNSSNPVATLRSNQVIKKLVYEVQHNPAGSTSTTFNNTFRFNFVMPTSPATLYVNHAASGTNNGSSWSNAYTSLQTGIDNAFPGDQVWVAKGTYKPSSSYERTNTSRFYHFRLPNSVSVYGGFVSGQTDTAQRSDYGIGGANETILSGDLNGNDNYTVTPWTGVGENSYHVIYHPPGTCMGLTSTLNGCTIKGGYANSTGTDADGGGMYLTESTSIRFNRVNLINNYSADDGAAMYLINGANNDSSRVYFRDLNVKSNVSASDAAMYLTNDSEAVFEYVNFEGNKSSFRGGALHFTSAAFGFLGNVTVSNNSAIGTDAQGGGVFVTGASTNVQLSNVSVTGNVCQATNATLPNETGGGGIAVWSAATAVISNGTIGNNTANIDGGGMIVSTGATVTITHTTISNNTADDGGGIYLDNAGTTINATGLTLSANTAADDAGGMFLSDGCSMTATSLTISDNTASGDDGGGFLISGGSTLTATNVLIRGNSALGDDGGGFANDASTVTINNGTIVGNSCRDDGGGVKAQTSGTSTLNNCIVWGNVVGQPPGSSSATGKQIDVGSGTTVVLNHSNITTTTKVTGTNGSEISGGGTLTVGSGNITSDPLFSNTSIGDYRITAGSPAADAGNDSYNSETTDIRGTGFGRKLLKTSASTAGTIDMGAYEYNTGRDAKKTWTNGTTNNLWNVAGNWSDNALPLAGDSIEVSSGTPQLNVDFTTDRTVTFSGTSGFTLLPTTGFSVGATGTLALGGRPVTLKSDATGTARIGQVLGSLTGATNVTVERYLPAGRKWRFLCAPVIGGTNNSVFYNWQNNGTPAGATGVEIWGPLGTANPSAAGSNGLAVGPHPSMRSYDVTWQGVTDTRNTQLFNATTNNGFSLFLTGPYNNGSTQYIGGPGNLPNGVPSTLSATGTLVTGTHTKTLNAATAGQYFLVANPYASPVDPGSFTDAGTVNRTNLQGTLHMWDAKQGGTYNLGRFVSYSIAGRAYSNAGAGTGYPDNSVLIQSGQSFFVQAINPGAATLVFRESSKGTATTMSMMGDSEERRRIPSLRFQLWQDTVNYDGAVAFFHDAGSRGIDEHDARKLLNGSDNLGLRREGMTLVFEHRPALASNDTLQLHLGQMRRQTFTLSIEPDGLPLAEGSGLRLLDRYTGKETPIKADGRTQVEFTVNADSASTGERFLVVLAAKPTNNGSSAESEPLVKMKPYPNPVSGSSKFRVELDRERAPWGVSMIDAGGRTVWSRGRVEAAEGRLEVDMSAMAAGVYHLVMTDSKGEVTVSKVLRQ